MIAPLISAVGSRADSPSWFAAASLPVLRRAGWFALAAAAALLAAPAAGEVTYSLTPYSGLIPMAVNNAGVVVGTDSLTWDETPYHWSQATGRVETPLGSAYVGVAQDINDNGLVCGWRQWIAGYTGIADAWLYDTHSAAFVPVYDSAMSHAMAITDSSLPTAGGTYTYTNYSGNIRYYRASLYESAGGTAYSVTRIGGGHRVEAMNNRGLAVGHLGGGDVDAFAYTADGTFTLLTGLAPDRLEAARDVNDNGHIVGYAANADGLDRATLWLNAATPVNLGVLANSIGMSGLQESQAYEINRWGDVVGWSHLWLEDLGRQTHAFVYRDGVMIDLNALTEPGVPTISTAYAINDVGQIATNIGLLTPYYLADGGFDNALGADWSHVSPAGTVDIVTLAEDANDPVLRLQTGSPVSVAQTLDTPAQPFVLAFDYRFETLTGELAVSVNGMEIIDPLMAADLAWHRYEGLITDESLFGLRNAELLFTLDGASLSVAYLDDVALTPSPLPEPSVLALLGLSLAAWPRRRRPASGVSCRRG